MLKISMFWPKADTPVRPGTAFLFFPLPPISIFHSPPAHPFSATIMSTDTPQYTLYTNGRKTIKKEELNDPSIITTAGLGSGDLDIRSPNIYRPPPCFAGVAVERHLPAITATHEQELGRVEKEIEMKKKEAAEAVTELLAGEAELEKLKVEIRRRVAEIEAEADPLEEKLYWLRRKVSPKTHSLERRQKEIAQRLAALRDLQQKRQALDK